MLSRTYLTHRNCIIFPKQRSTSSFDFIETVYSVTSEDAFVLTFWKLHSCLLAPVQKTITCLIYWSSN